MLEFVKRIPDPTLFGLTYDEYLQRKNHKTSKAVREILKFTEENNKSEADVKYRLIDNKLNYLANCFEDLSSQKEEIIILWKLIIDYIDVDNIDLLENTYNMFIQHIISYSVEAKISSEELEKLDSTLHHKICDTIELKFKNFISTHPVLLYNYWFSKRELFFEFMGIGRTTGDSTKLRYIYQRNTKTISELKKDDPYNYLKFIDIFKIQFKNDPIDYRHKNIEFYKEKCLEQVIIAKENGYFDIYYHLLEDYYTIKLNKCTNWAFKKFIGYGEKPQNLILPFIGFNILFSIIFASTNLEFYYAPNLCHSNWGEKFLNFLYFNNTTMLTVGYGDIYPLGFFSKMFVFILQILGFTISSSFVALLLRKLLRY